MICDDAAEFVSALCDGETIPADAASHIGGCPECAARLRDYLALGIEMRRTASINLAQPLAFPRWERPQNLLATWWQKGWTFMRIPKLAFVFLIAGLVVLASFVAVGNVRARTTGKVVLLNSVGPRGPICDCPLSTEDPSRPGCLWYGKIGSLLVAYQVQLLERDGDRVRLAIRTHTAPVTPGTHLFSPSDLDNTPAREFWFEPGERLNVDVSQVGTVTVTGEWLDHMPVLIGKEDLSPSPNEIRFASPLMLRDGVVVGDLIGSIGGTFSTDDRDYASAIYIPGEGRFLISQVPMKDAIEAKVKMSRVSFEDGGHEWELVNGAPITRADHLWVLHQMDYKSKVLADHASFGNTKLIQIEPGLWTPEQQPR